MYGIGPVLLLTTAREVELAGLGHCDVLEPIEDMIIYSITLTKGTCLAREGKVYSVFYKFTVYLISCTCYCMNSLL